MNPQRWVSVAESVAFVPQTGRFVSRGGEKLDAALQQFELDASGKTAIDVGSSTGGFTDCLLQAGAKHVTAVDVGTNQLDGKLRSHPRVSVYEQTNIRTADQGIFAHGPYDLLVADLSFISLTVVMKQLVGLVRKGGDLILLVKPQFESRAEEATAGKGVIRDPAIWERTLGEVRAAAQAQNATTIGVMESPLRGAKGNVEFLLHLRVGEAHQVGIDQQKAEAEAEANPEQGAV